MPSEGHFTHIHEHPEISQRDLGFIRAYLPTARRILDVGAGKGGFVQLATERGFKAIALDLDPDVIPIWQSAHVTGVLGDVLCPPLREEMFDVVRAKEILEHVSNPLALVRVLRKLLTPGGLLLAHVPSPYSQLYPVGNFWDDYTHIRPLSRLGLQRLIEDAGMRMRHIRGYTAGRNRIERVLLTPLGRIVPHTYVLIAQNTRVPAEGT